MLPALRGNSRMLCGLVEAVRTFPAVKAIAKSARDLGEFYLSMLPRFNDPSRIEEYKRTGTYASGYVTCWFPAMEGLVRLGNLTGEKKYIDAAGKIADFYQQFDKIPADHAHGILCCQVALLDLYEETKDASYLKRSAKRRLLNGYMPSRRITDRQLPLVSNTSIHFFIRAYPCHLPQCMDEVFGHVRCAPIVVQFLFSGSSGDAGAHWPSFAASSLDVLPRYSLFSSR